MTIVFRMGEMPLANGFLRSNELRQAEPRYPLELALCQTCGLAQITATVPRDVLFGEYLYFSSYSNTMVHHADELVELVLSLRDVGPGGLAVELGSNDGYLLQHFVRRGIPVLGIEPARNVATAASARGIPTLSEFFDRDLAETLRRQGRLADIIIANNVLAHVSDVNSFVGGIRILLRDDGLCIIEVPYVQDLLDKTEFDTIYHEHVCYFSVSALQELFRRHDLIIERVEHLPVHGGSLRIYVGRHGRLVDGSVAAMVRDEGRSGLSSPEPYYRFGREAERVRASLLDVLHGLKAAGSRIAGYGAAAKGTVLLNYCGIGPDLLDFVVDRNPHKQGRYVPGVRIPIAAPDALISRRPEYVLLLAWNVSDEIVAQQAGYRASGGRFIVPIPTPVIR